MAFNKIECFKIQIMKTKNDNILDIHNYEPVHQIMCDKANFINEPVIIVADPFLFVHNGRLYLFYEQKKLYHNGVLMMTSTSDLDIWSEPVVVLKEDFHLSYPWVFKDNGHVYMVPESCEDASIRLYEANNDKLDSFSLVKKLLKQPYIEDITMSFADTSIFKENNIYYLHTTICVNGVNQLRLYYADNLFGPYIEHTRSPIIISVKYGRNAGNLFKWNDMLLRPAQDCESRYGDNVHLMKVENMTTEEYEEILYKEYIIDSDMDFYREGGHQYNLAAFRGYTVLATDAKEYHNYFFNRFMHKFGKYK